MSLKRYDTNEALKKISKTPNKPSLSDLVAVYIDETVSCYAAGCRLQNIENDIPIPIICINTACQIEYALILVWMSHNYYCSKSPSDKESQNFLDELVTKILKLICNQIRQLPFSQNEANEVLISHFQYYDRNAFDKDGNFDFKYFTMSISSLLITEAKSNHMDILSESVIICNFTEMIENAMEISERFSQNFEKIINIINSEEESSTSRIEKPQKVFLLIGKDIAAGYHKFSAQSKSSGFVVIYPPNTNRNDEIGRIQVFKNTSIYLKTGYSIVLDNCVLIQKKKRFFF